MKKYKSLLTYALLLLAAVCVVLLKPTPRPNPPGALTLAPPEQLKHFTFGYNENAADGLWLRVIQDIDVCDAHSKTGTKAVTKNILQQTKGEILAPSQCDRGWVYRMLDGITELTPRFVAAYTYGAVILSVVVDDREGARLLFEKGVRQFPKKWQIAYGAAYHYLYESQDPKRAAELLVQAGQNGAPPWVFALAARLYTRAGQAFLGQSVLEQALKQETDQEGKNAVRIRQRLDEINSVLREESSSL